MMAFGCTLKVAGGDVLSGTVIRTSEEEARSSGGVSKRWSFEANKSPPLFSYHSFSEGGLAEIS